MEYIKVKYVHFSQIRPMVLDFNKCHESPPELFYNPDGDWENLEYTINKVLVENNMNNYNYSNDYRCWFCDIFREVWDEDELYDLIQKNYALDEEIDTYRKLKIIH